MKKRVRRSPDETRQLILDASDQVFARSTPDEVGLKEIAREARVSHALVTHYFGTYRALVDATLDRRLTRARAAAVTRFMSAGFGGSDTPLIDAVIELVREPATLRLMAWTAITHRGSSTFTGRAQGTRLAVDLIFERLRSRQIPVTRHRVESAVAVAVGAILGLSLFGPALRAALGDDKQFDVMALRPELAAMMRLYLTQS